MATHVCLAVVSRANAGRRWGTHRARTAGVRSLRPDGATAEGVPAAECQNRRPKSFVVPQLLTVVWEQFVESFNFRPAKDQSLR